MRLKIAQLEALPTPINNTEYTPLIYTHGSNLHLVSSKQKKIMFNQLPAANYHRFST